jgi:hypothetical protein
MGVIRPVATDNQQLDDYIANTPYPTEIESEPSDLDMYINSVSSGEQMASGPRYNIGPVEAGMNMSQAMMWEGLDSAAQAAGLDTPQWLKEAIADNKDIAQSADIEDFGDKLLFAGGQLIPAVGGTLIGATVAPFLGMSSAFGTMIGGGLASMGMTLGDLQGKALALDPSHLADLKQIGLGILMALPDAFAISKAKHLLSPVRDLVKDSTLESLKAVRGAKNVASRVVGDSVTIGAFEGAQDFATGIGANYVTGTDIDMSRITSLANSAAEEAVIGAILGVPLSGANIATGRVAENQAIRNEQLAEELRQEQAANAQYVAEVGGEGSTIYDITDVSGEINPEAIKYVPMPMSGKNPGLFTLGANVLVGNVTDNIKARNPDNPFVQLNMQQLNLTPQERRQGRLTVHEEATPWKGKLKLEEGAAFWAAPESERQASLDRKANDELNMENPVDKSLWDMFHGEWLQNKVIESSRGEINVLDKDSKWQDPTYVPLSDTLDYGSIAQDSSWITDLEQSMTEAGKSEGQIEKAQNIIQAKIEDYIEFGNDLSITSQRMSKREIAIKKALETSLQEGELDYKKIRGQINALRSDDSDLSVVKNTELTLDRALKDVPETWLGKHKRKGVTASQIVGEHVDRIMEHLAHIKRFGMNDELFHEMVANAIVWGNANNKPLKQKDIDQMYDALRISKRMHLKPIDQKWRERQANARAILNTNLLGLSALVSIPESLSIPLATDMATAAKGLKATLAKDPSLTTMSNLNQSLDGAVQFVANRANQDTRTMRRWEHWFIQNLTGLPQLQYFLTNWAVKSMDLDNRRLIQKLQSVDQGESNQAYLTLSQRGIDTEKATNWMESGFDTDHDYFVEEYIPQVGAQARDVIVDPDPVDKPQWHSYEGLQLLSQLKGFMTVFTRRVMRGHMEKMAGLNTAAHNRELALRLAPYVAMYIVGQMGIGALRETVSKGEVDDEKTLLTRGWNAFGYLGGAAYFVDPVNAMLWRSDPLASVAGPGPSIALNLTGATVRSIAAMDPDEAIKRTVKTVIPNMPFMGAVEEMLIEAFGAD